MNWRLSNRTRRQAPRFRPSLELLEGRALPSVAVTQFIDPSGAAGLRVATDGRDDTVAITDNSTNHTTTVVANGVTVTFVNQFALFDLDLRSKKDTLAFDLVGALDHRQDDVQVSLGKGENHFTFNPGLTAIVNHSDVNLNVRGHNGNDFVNLSFGDILESRVNVAASHLGGSKTVAARSEVQDSITFGTLRAGIRNSSVDVNVGLGSGNNNLAFNYGSDLGHLAGAGVAADFGPSTFNVNITGSNRGQDVDNVTLFANGEVNTGSTLNFNVQFIAGNNSFQGVIDAANFQIDDDGGEFISDAHLGGAAHFNINGGSGSDTISFQSINQDSTIELSGLLDINVHGSSGQDKINVDFGAGPTNTGGFLDDDPFELRATNRSFRLRLNGGDAGDTIHVNLANGSRATFSYDVAILGGDGDDVLTFAGANNNDSADGDGPTFGPAGAVLIDGGGGTNLAVIAGNFPVRAINVELVNPIATRFTGEQDGVNLTVPAPGNGSIVNEGQGFTLGSGAFTATFGGDGSAFHIGNPDFYDFINGGRDFFGVRGPGTGVITFDGAPAASVTILARGSHLGINNPELDFDGDDGLPDVPGPIGEAAGTVRAFTPDGQLIAEFPLRNDFPDGGFRTGDNLGEFTFNGPVARIELINAGDAGSFADIAKITASAIPDSSGGAAGARAHLPRKGTAGDATAFLLKDLASPTAALSQPTTPALTAATSPPGALEPASVDQLFAPKSLKEETPALTHNPSHAVDAAFADLFRLSV